MYPRSQGVALSKSIKVIQVSLLVVKGCLLMSLVFSGGETENVHIQPVLQLIDFVTEQIDRYSNKKSSNNLDLSR